MHREHFTPRCPEGKHFSPIMQARKGKKKSVPPNGVCFLGLYFPEKNPARGILQHEMRVVLQR